MSGCLLSVVDGRYSLLLPLAIDHIIVAGDSNGASPLILKTTYSEIQTLDRYHGIKTGLFQGWFFYVLEIILCLQ